MNTRSSMLALTSGVLLTVFSGMALATSQKSPTPSAAKQSSAKGQSKVPTTEISRGAIVSIDANRLVLSQKRNGKAEELSFILNPQTSRKGDIAVGNQVTVHYRTQNSEHVATSIQGTAQKALNGAKAKSKKG